MSNKKHQEEQYLDLIKDILENGVKQTDAGTGDVTYSVFGRQLRFNLEEGFPLLTTKKVYWKGVLEELCWFLSGQNNIKYLVDRNVHIWDDYPYRIYREKIEKGEYPDITKEEFIEKIINDNNFSEKHGSMSHVYGEMWRAWPATDGRKIDQVQWIVDKLREDPDAHNTLVTAWNPEYMYEMANREDACRFPICHNMYQVNVKDGKLSLQLYQRSADIFLGVPFNIASYALLTHILAEVTGNKPGEFIHVFGDVHVYENHREQVREQIGRKPLKLPNIKFNKKFKEIDDFLPEFVDLIDYNPHPPIKAELAVVGGLVTDSWKKYVQKGKKK